MTWLIKGHARLMRLCFYSDGDEMEVKEVSFLAESLRGSASQQVPQIVFRGKTMKEAPLSTHHRENKLKVRSEHTMDRKKNVYTNPILKGDYSDPDVIRVGDDYYMVSSSFTYFPGMPLLHSRDLVHWRTVNHVCRHLPFDCYESPNHRNGTWAPSIRYHEGVFYVYVCAPDEGLFCFKTEDPLGRWDMYHVAEVAGWIDPCPFWDDDGSAYLVHAFANSRVGLKSILYLHKMSADGTQILDHGRLVFDGGSEHVTTEGPKMYKRAEYYYILAPAGGVATGWQLAMRSKNIYGPYELKTVLEQGETRVNGPHQGAWLDTPSGEEWFIHFQDVGPYGRIPHLQPVSFIDGWPEMGVKPAGGSVGNPVMEYFAPDTGFWDEGLLPQTSDEFDGEKLGLQWQWQANPKERWYSLNENPGSLRLYAHKIGKSDTLCDAGQFLSQLMQHFEFDVDVKLNFAPWADGDRAGLAMLCYEYQYIAVEKTDAGVEVAVYGGKVDRDEKGAGNPFESRLAWKALKSGSVYLRMSVRGNCFVTYSYSENGEEFLPLGEGFAATKGGWVSAKPGIFCANFARKTGPGYCDFDYFRVTAR
ncbi:MAG: glycoside hydrolase 43 family protein [Christensenellales bacterium]